jgi:tRNA pseudouridine55 synthase
VGRRRAGEKISGWIALDKPYGLGSTEAVAKVRRLFNAAKAGHAGTLDPLASGALPIALGEATKTVPFLMDATKTYRFTIAWGAATTTLDLEGEVVARSDARPSPAEVREAAQGFVGDILQAPPLYSAVRVGGVRAYDLARRGEAPALTPRPVRIHAIEVEAPEGPDHATLRIECGKGVYVRSLCADLAQSLGVLGHVAALRRLRVGPFAESALISLESLRDLVHDAAGSKVLLPVETALDDIPALAVTHEDAFRLRQGRAIVLLPRQVEALRTSLAARVSGSGSSHLVSARSADGGVVALCELAAGRLQPTRVFQHTET